MSKYYAVANGRSIGIFRTWNECKAQVNEFKNAKFKSFGSEREAKSYLAENGVGANTEIPTQVEFLTAFGQFKEYDPSALFVDAACSGNPGLLEYRGVRIVDGAIQEVFRSGVFPKGTNNLGEFLAIVHGLVYSTKTGYKGIIYSDSQTAMAWVRDKVPNTTLGRNEQTADLWSALDKSVMFLKSRTFENRLVKWETDKWGEIPADFGRK